MMHTRKMQSQSVYTYIIELFHRNVLSKVWGSVDSLYFLTFCNSTGSRGTGGGAMMSSQRARCPTYNTDIDRMTPDRNILIMLIMIAPPLAACHNSLQYQPSIQPFKMLFFS